VRQGAGARKAAVALLSLPEDVAAAVLARLSEAEVHQLRQEMLGLRQVGDAEAAEVLDELSAALSTPLALARSAGDAYLYRLAQRAFGEERAGQLLRPPAAEPDAVERLRGARVHDLAALLGDEHPQVAAMVLTQLSAALAAKVLAAMAPELAAEVLLRTADLQEVPEHAAAEASQALVRALEATGSGRGTRAARFDGLRFSAAVMQELASPYAAELLERMGEEDRRAAARLRGAASALESAVGVEPAVELPRSGSRSAS
jgi:flagellar motor switch protein FliG